MDDKQFAPMAISKFTKKRQGRSFEVRLNKIKGELANCKYFPLPLVCDCKNQQNNYYRSEIPNLLSSTDNSCCNECGKETSYVQLDNDIIRDKYIFPGSKKYERRIHFNTKVHRLIGEGALIILLKDAFAIERFLELNPDIRGSSWNLVGPKTIKTACERLGFLANPKKRRYPDFWIQVRMMLNLQPCHANIPSEFIARLYWRYKLVDVAFNQVLKKSANNNRLYKARNIMTINYTLLQLLRLENEELFKLNAKFMPLSNNPDSPDVNNVRWKLICEYCQKNFGKTFTGPDDCSGIYYFDWTYRPLTSKDILDYVVYFR